MGGAICSPNVLPTTSSRINAGMTEIMPMNATSRRVRTGSGRLRSMRSTSHIANNAGMAPDSAICQLAAPTVGRVFTSSGDEFQPGRRRLIQTTAMRFALVMLLVAAVATRAEAGRGTASLKYLPDDTNVVLASDLARARNSPIFKKLFKLAREQITWLDTLASAQPIEKQVDTIVIGATAD